MTDITTLMIRDPLKHTEQDIDLIIAKLREQRHLFNSPTAKTPKAPKGAPAPSIDLTDLSL